VIKTRVTSPNDATNGGNANARGRVAKSTFVLAMSRKSDSGTEVVTQRLLKLAPVRKNRGDVERRATVSGNFHESSPVDRL
jgi:hypothetical protein